MPVPLYASFLRVFSPVGTFPAAEAQRWRRYARTADERSSALAAERRASLAALPTGRLELPGETALLMDVDGILHVCPLRTQVRAWEAAAAYAPPLPAPMVDLLRPRAQVEQATAALAAWQEANPGLVSQVLTSPWHVPAAWLALFDPVERQVVEGAVRHLTTVPRARRRGVAALAVLGETLPQAPTAETLRRTVEWLTVFPDTARLELDYGELIRLLGPAGLVADTSVADVTEALTRLAAGDAPGAARAYERVLERWRPLQLLEHAS